MIDVYHTGSSNEHVRLEGTIKGVAQIRRGGIEKDVVFRRFVKATVGKLVPRGKAFKPRHLWVITPFIIITLPILIPILIIDSVRNTVRRPPKDFTVQ